MTEVEQDSIAGSMFGTYLYVEPKAPEPEVNPYLENLPTDEELAALVAEQSRTSDVHGVLLSEQAGLPSLREHAVVTGDAVALTNVKAREAAIVDEIAMANVAAAKARYQLCLARHALATTNRERTRDKAYALGPAIENGYPQGMAKSLEATTAYEGFQIETRERAIELGAAKRALDSAIAAAKGGN